MAVSYRLSVIGYRLSAIGYQLINNQSQTSELSSRRA